MIVWRFHPYLPNQAMSSTTNGANTTAIRERKQPSKVAQIYLFWYNVVQAFGWYEKKKKKKKVWIKPLRGDKIILFS